MELTLYYAGPLKANADAKTKHELRQHFHRQLKLLWEQEPLSSVRDLLQVDPTGKKTSVIIRRNKYNFAPLIGTILRTYAEVQIALLRPGPPGSILASGGDIDNRLKTLFDSLKVPEANALPADALPQSEEDPFFCLLEDDKLIQAVSVSTDQLLEPSLGPIDVVILLHVKTRVSGLSWVNSVFV